MNKQLIALLAACAAVLALGAGYVLLRQSGADAASSAGTEPTVPAAHLEQITDITYQNAGEEIHLIKLNDTWQWAQDADFPVIQTYAAAMANWGAALNATRLVTETPDNLAEYGLDAPQNTIRFAADGGSYTVLLGSQNGQTEDYYIQIQGETAVYTVDSSFYQAFSYAQEALLDVEDWPVVSAAAIRSVQLTRADGTGFALTVTPAKAAAADAQSASAVTGSSSHTSDSALPSASAVDSASSPASATGTETYTLSQNGGAAAEIPAASANTVLGQLTALSFTGCSNYKATAADLAACGLDTPSTARLTVQYEGATEPQTFSLLIGNGSADGVYFVKQADSRAINTMDGASLSALLTTDAASLAAAAES